MGQGGLAVLIQGWGSCHALTNVGVITWVILNPGNFLSRRIYVSFSRKMFMESVSQPTSQPASQSVSQSHS